MISRQTYYAFGAMRTSDNAPITSITEYNYSGQPFDTSDGLSYYQARYYDSAPNRFIQPDSIIPNIYNPQDLNRYSYVRNNPVRYTDATGHGDPITWALQWQSWSPSISGLLSFVSPMSAGIACLVLCWGVYAIDIQMAVGYNSDPFSLPYNSECGCLESPGYAQAKARGIPTTNTHISASGEPADPGGLQPDKPSGSDSPPPGFHKGKNKVFWIGRNKPSDGSPGYKEVAGDNEGSFYSMDESGMDPEKAIENNLANIRFAYNNGYQIRLATPVGDDLGRLPIEMKFIREVLRLRLDETTRIFYPE